MAGKSLSTSFASFLLLLCSALFSSSCGSSPQSKTGADDSVNKVGLPVNGNAQEIQQAAGEQQKQVLWDFRTEETKEQKFTKAETRVVMTYLFGDKWDTELEISSRFSGSFTKPNANETLYYVGGCTEDDGEGFKSTANCAHASWWNAGWIAIFDGTTPVAKIEAALGYQIGKVTDVNGDGISEILSLSGYSNQGETETGGALGRIETEKYAEIKTFSGSADTCGSDPSFMAQKAKATVVSFMPTSDGKMPDFTEEYFQNKCGKTPWKKISKKQFDAE